MWGICSAQQLYATVIKLCDANKPFYTEKVRNRKDWVTCVELAISQERV